MERRVVKIGSNWDIRFKEVTDVRKYRPREIMRAWNEEVNGNDHDFEPRIPWSCSASGSVAPRSKEIRRTLPWQENPYLDSERMATP